MTHFLVPLLASVAIASVAVVVDGFVSSTASTATTRSFQQQNQCSTTELFFGIPKFLEPKNKDDDDDDDENNSNNNNKSSKDPKLENEKKIGLGSLFQLITAGAGAPFLGDFQGVDKETGNFMFSLEANNLVDEDGKSKQTSMPYFESGWVDPKDLEKEEKRKQGGGFKLPWQK
jgi:hypothetical protein